MTSKKKLQTILFAHSAGPQYGKGKGSYDLVKYLKLKLADKFEILFPKIEKPNTPTYAKYNKMFASSFAKITQPVILIGHSLGGSTLLKYLSEEKPNISISGLFLISTPHWKSNMKEFELWNINHGVPSTWDGRGLKADSLLDLLFIYFLATLYYCSLTEYHYLLY